MERIEKISRARKQDEQSQKNRINKMKWIRDAKKDVKATGVGNREEKVRSKNG